jgi:hypothetical protein
MENDMEPVSTETTSEILEKLKSFKWVLVILVAVAAGIIGYFIIFRTHPAQATVEKVFQLVEEGDIEGVMEYMDPEGQLGTLWHENQQGARDALLDLMDRYRLEFSSLSFNTQAEGNYAEVELRGGTAIIYDRNEEGPPEVTLPIGELDLVFFVEKKGDDWLIEGVNYDLLQILSEDGGFLPF